MWKTAKPYLIVASATLNVAFVAMWIAHAAPSGALPEDDGHGGPEPVVWCPLHRELGVTQEQWSEIEPRLRAFQADAGEIRQQIDAIRMEVIDLIAAEEPDLDAIFAKQDEILATKRQMQRLVVEHLLAEKRVLTPEQQRQLFAMLRDRSGCPADPPMSGRPGRGLGRTFRGRDEG
jgi:Spy/CpxP family protein refolding chaperone